MPESYHKRTRSSPEADVLSTPFHVTIHAEGGGAAAGRSTFRRSFEEVADGLAGLPRMFVEPDGAFLWVASEEPGWQIDGVLYDGVGGLWYVELKGHCPQPRFDELLSALGWPQTSVRFHLVREAVTLSEHEFRCRVGWP